MIAPEGQMFAHAVVAVTANDQVIEHLHLHQATTGNQAASGVNVVAAGDGVTRGVIMGNQKRMGIVL
jgi:hypothetical protein